MPKARSRQSRMPVSGDFLIAPRRKAIPHEFVLDALASLSPRTNPMFGCLAIYVHFPGVHREEKIVGVLRDRPTAPADNGVWLATTLEHHASLRKDFPSMRSIGVLGKAVTGWQLLPVDAPDFEESALRFCELVIARDPRIGKVPRPKRPKGKQKLVVQNKVRQNKARQNKVRQNNAQTVKKKRRNK